MVDARETRAKNGRCPGCGAAWFRGYHRADACVTCAADVAEFDKLARMYDAPSCLVAQTDASLKACDE